MVKIWVACNLLVALLVTQCYTLPTPTSAPSEPPVPEPMDASTPKPDEPPVKPETPAPVAPKPQNDFEKMIIKSEELLDLLESVYISITTKPDQETFNDTDSEEKKLVYDFQGDVVRIATDTFTLIKSAKTHLKDADKATAKNLTDHSKTIVTEVRKISQFINDAFEKFILRAGKDDLKEKTLSKMDDFLAFAGSLVEDWDFEDSEILIQKCKDHNLQEIIANFGLTNKELYRTQLINSDYDDESAMLVDDMENAILAKFAFLYPICEYLVKEPENSQHIKKIVQSNVNSVKANGMNDFRNSRIWNAQFLKPRAEDVIEDGKSPADDVYGMMKGRYGYLKEPQSNKDFDYFVQLDAAFDSYYCSFSSNSKYVSFDKTVIIGQPVPAENCTILNVNDDICGVVKTSMDGMTNFVNKIQTTLCPRHTICVVNQDCTNNSCRYAGAASVDSVKCEAKALQLIIL